MGIKSVFIDEGAVAFLYIAKTSLKATESCILSLGNVNYSKHWAFILRKINQNTGKTVSINVLIITYFKTT